MATLNSCRSDLRKIIRELESIRDGIKSEFVGIGQDICSDCIDGVVEKYNYVLRCLYNVDENLIADIVNGDN